MAGVGSSRQTVAEGSDRIVYVLTRNDETVATFSRDRAERMLRSGGGNVSKTVVDVDAVVEGVMADMDGMERLAVTRTPRSDSDVIVYSVVTEPGGVDGRDPSDRGGVVKFASLAQEEARKRKDGWSTVRPSAENLKRVAERAMSDLGPVERLCVDAKYSHDRARDHALVGFLFEEGGREFRVEPSPSGLSEEFAQVRDVGSGATRTESLAYVTSKLAKVDVHVAMASELFGVGNQVRNRVHRVGAFMATNVPSVESGLQAGRLLDQARELLERIDRTLGSMERAPENEFYQAYEDSPSFGR